MLSGTPARLDIEFGWSEARWTVTEEEGRQGSIVYLLLARTGDQWKELVQVRTAWNSGVVSSNTESNVSY